MPNGAPGAAQRKDSKFIIFENFKRLNTAEVRQGLREDEFAWVENLQPQADNNWTTLPGPGLSLITLPVTFVSTFFGTLKGVDYIIGFTSTGSAYAVRVDTGATLPAGGLPFAPGGTFSVPGQVVNGFTSPGPDVTSWQGQRFLFNDLLAGYSTWDGTTFSRQGGLSANIPVTNGGTGYTTAPTVIISGGSGSGATAVATIGPPAVAGLFLDAFGSGYASAPGVAFSGGGGSGASGHTTVDPRACLGVNLVANGAYAKDGIGPYNITISFVGGGSPTVVASATLTLSQNALGQVFVVSIDNFNGGSGYTSIPTVVFTPNAHLSTFSPAGAQVTGIGDGRVTGIFLDNPGSGYTSPPTVILTGGGGGVGAHAFATIGGGSVIGVTLTNPGSGYLPSDKDVSLGGTLKATFSGGGGSGAVAFLSVAPFIPAGTSLAVFQGRVWINFVANGQLNGLGWSGVGSVSQGIEAWNDWDPAHAAGSLILPDTDLVHQITGLRSFNNFLWIIGDQSIKQIGNISLNSTGNVTVFTILTLSSDQGTTFLRSCTSFNRVFFFANRNGIYAVFGSSVQKVSGDLDGIWQRVDFTQPPQGALIDIAGTHCVQWLVKYNDQYFARGAISLFLIFDGKRWFPGAQRYTEKVLTQYCTLGSPWGSMVSSGGDLTPVFANANATVTVQLLTALSHHGNPVQRKKTVRLGYSVTLLTTPAQLTFTPVTDEGGATKLINLVSGYQTRTVADPNVSGTHLGYYIAGTMAGFTLTNLRIEYQETNIGNQN